jgi:hypothetical protein
MKHYSLFIPVLFLLILSGCSKDPAYESSADGAQGTFSLNIDTRVRDQFFKLNKDYYDVKGYRYNVTTLQYYISHLSLVKEDGTLQEVSDVALMDYETSNLGDIQKVSAKAPAGTYTGIRFWLGVDSVLNNKGPNDYDRDHPLSVYKGTYWSWNTGYRFVIFDCKSDTIVNDTSATPYLADCSYHPGTNALYTEVQFPARTIVLGQDETYDYNVKLDINKMFYSATDTIIKYQRPLSHTTDNFPLAQEFITDMAGAFSEQ